MARDPRGEVPIIFADIGDTAPPTVANFNEGYELAFEQTAGKKPTREGTNKIYQQLYAMGRDISQFGGSLPYTATIDFIPDAIVTEAGVLFICLLANGPATAVKIPGAGGSETFWTTTSAATTAATQTEQETGTDNTVFVTPANQQFHSSAAKAGVQFNGKGAVAILDSFNIASIVDNGTGDYSFNLTNAMTTVNYQAICGSQQFNSSRNDAGYGVNDSATARTVSNIRTRNHIGSTAAINGGARDDDGLAMMIYGDLA